MNHNDGCECEACRDGLEAVERRQAELMKKHGWVADLVKDDEDCPYHTNYHTHGLEKYGHPDLQACLPLDPRTVHSVMSTLVEKIKKGRKFKECEIVNGIIKGFPITFVEAEETGRQVLRVIFPDAQGNLSPETILPTYRCQYKGTVYLLASGTELDCEDH